MPPASEMDDAVARAAICLMIDPCRFGVVKEGEEDANAMPVAGGRQTNACITTPTIPGSSGTGAGGAA